MKIFITSFILRIIKIVHLDYKIIRTPIYTLNATHLKACNLIKIVINHQIIMKIKLSHKPNFKHFIVKKKNNQKRINSYSATETI